MDEVVDELRKMTDSPEDTDDEFILPEKGHARKKISKDDFKTIDNGDGDKRIAFVDGGNAEILSSPSFSLHLIRIYCCIYAGKRKIGSKKHEFWSLTKPVVKEGISYDVKIIGSDLLKNMTFDPSDDTLREGIYDANISKFGNIVRRFAELSAADGIAKERSAEIIVLDGNLQKSYVGEDVYLKSLIDDCNRNTIRLTAISKTNSAITNKGRSATRLLSTMAPAGIWFCEIVDENAADLPKIGFAKLHPSAKHVFKIDYFDGSVFKELSDHSKDPIFLGYPYGLIEADSFARVSNREKQLLRTSILTKLGQKSDLIALLSNSDAHQVLDRLQY